jgi:hypothetical protein
MNHRGSVAYCGRPARLVDGGKVSVMSLTNSTADPWTTGDLTILERCASVGLPAVVIALKLGRCVSAVRVKAAEYGVRLDSSVCERRS